MKAKENRNYIFAMAQEHWRSSAYYLVLLLCILNALFGVLVAAKTSYFEGWITIETNSNFHAFFLAILFIDVMMQRRQEEKLVGIHLYYQTRRQYHLARLKQIVCTTIFLFLIQRLFILIGLNIFNSSNVGLENLAVYSVPNWCYLAAILTRNLAYMTILALIIYQVLTLVKEKYVVFLMIVLLVYFLGDRILFAPTMIIDQIWKIPLSIRQQFGQNHYSTFLFELAGSALYCCLLMWIAYFEFLFSMRNKKELVL